MQQTCAQCGSSFEITDDDLKFYEHVSPVFGGKRYSIPSPTRCPDCRQQRRLAICNEFNLYPGKCDLCGKETIVQFEPSDTRTIYCRDCWHSDKWNACDFGRDIDFTRPFFEQFKELRDSLPAQGLDMQGNVVNCDYIHYAGSSKNCYLIMHADFCEDCYYGYGFKKNTSCVDGFYNLHCELSYDCVDCHKCYHLVGSQECLNCNTGAFLRDCIGCNNCFLCVGLREKEFCFENEQLTKDEYKKRIAEIDLRSYAQYQVCKKKRRELELTHTFKEFQGHNLENCLGNHLYNCKNLRESFDCEDVEDGKCCYQVVLAAKDVHDIYQYGSNLQASYECAISGEDSFHLRFSFGCHMGCSELMYCFYMEASRDCFGCAYMQKNHHCVFNKQYTKEEYDALVLRLIEHMKQTGEWGEFFPMSLSQFGYNKTSAQMYYPLEKDGAMKISAAWSDYEPPPPQVAKVIPADKLPDNSKDIPDDVLHWAIQCEVTGKPFKITPQELRFYRQMALPLPRRSWYQRHLDRFHQRNPRTLWDRKCAKCSASIQTTYAPDRPEIVYCEDCYQKEVY
ncbi:hypothetical protein COU80_02645 [Candidatus Peregrinibacteria bacterium CG10_big_fil_rev_8_21_14_0_10_55_24]|nr:MAG: hypothetical protein COU80_02645 [Candidatus Peregrinibacteria bacterium CG10_big_fil_rev_8_21_14_0_10_55_24]